MELTEGQKPINLLLICMHQHGLDVTSPDSNVSAHHVHFVQDHLQKEVTVGSYASFPPPNIPPSNLSPTDYLWVQQSPIALHTYPSEVSTRSSAGGTETSPRPHWKTYEQCEPSCRACLTANWGTGCTKHCKLFL